MQWLESGYAHGFNQRYGYEGHLFRQRFYSGLIESDWHLIETSRYIALNPVRGGLCRRPEDWTWSSYPAMIGRAEPGFVTVDELLGFFGNGAAAGVEFARFVDAGLQAPVALVA